MSIQPPKPPRLVAETAIERNEPESLTFSAEEWDRFDQHFKRRLAGKAKSDEISGRSTLLEVKSYYVVQRSATEYGVKIPERESEVARIDGDGRPYRDRRPKPIGKQQGLDEYAHD